MTLIYIQLINVILFYFKAYVANRDIKLLELISSEIITSCDPRFSANLPSSSIYIQARSSGGGLAEGDGDGVIHPKESWFEEDASGSYETEAKKLKVKIHVNPRFLPYLNVPQLNEESIGYPSAALPALNISTVSVSPLIETVVTQKSLQDPQNGASSTNGDTSNKLTGISSNTDVAKFQKLDNSMMNRQKHISSSSSIFDAECIPNSACSQIVSVSSSSCLPIVSKPEMNLDIPDADSESLNCLMETNKQEPWILGCRKLSNATHKFISNRLNESVDQTSSDVVNDMLHLLGKSFNKDLKAGVFTRESEKHCLVPPVPVCADKNSLISSAEKLQRDENNFFSSGTHCDVSSLTEIDSSKRYIGGKKNGSGDIRQLLNSSNTETNDASESRNKQVSDMLSKISNDSCQRFQPADSCRKVTPVETSKTCDLNLQSYTKGALNSNSSKKIREKMLPSSIGYPKVNIQQELINPVPPVIIYDDERHAIQSKLEMSPLIKKRKLIDTTLRSTLRSSNSFKDSEFCEQSDDVELICNKKSDHFLNAINRRIFLEVNVKPVPVGPMTQLIPLDHGTNVKDQNNSALPIRQPTTDANDGHESGSKRFVSLIKSSDFGSTDIAKTNLLKSTDVLLPNRSEMSTTGSTNFITEVSEQLNYSSSDRVTLNFDLMCPSRAAIEEAVGKVIEQDRDKCTPRPAVEEAVQKVLEQDRQNATLELKREIEKMEEALIQKRLAYINRKMDEKQANKDKSFKMHSNDASVNEEDDMILNLNLSWEDHRSFNTAMPDHKYKVVDSSLHLSHNSSEDQPASYFEKVCPNYNKSVYQNLSSSQLLERTRQKSTNHLKKIQLQNIVKDVRDNIDDEYETLCDKKMNPVMNLDECSTKGDMKCVPQIMDPYVYESLEGTESSLLAATGCTGLYESGLIIATSSENANVSKDIMKSSHFVGQKLVSVNQLEGDKSLHGKPMKIGHDFDMYTKSNSFDQLCNSDYDIEVSNKVFNSSINKVDTVGKPLPEKRYMEDKQPSLNKEIVSESIIQHSLKMLPHCNKSQMTQGKKSVCSEKDNLSILNSVSSDKQNKNRSCMSEIKYNDLKSTKLSLESVNFEKSKKIKVPQIPDEYSNSSVTLKPHLAKINKYRKLHDLSVHAICSMGTQDCSTCTENLVLQEGHSFLIDLHHSLDSPKSEYFEMPCVHLSKLVIDTQADMQSIECQTIRDILFKTLFDWSSRRPLDFFQLEPSFQNSLLLKNCPLVDSTVALMSKKFLKKIEAVAARLTTIGDSLIQSLLQNHILSPDNLVHCLFAELKQHLDFVSANSVLMFTDTAEMTRKKSHYDDIDKQNMYSMRQKRKTSDHPRSARIRTTRKVKISPLRNIPNTSLEKVLQQSDVSILQSSHNQSCPDNVENFVELVLPLKKLVTMGGTVNKALLSFTEEDENITVKSTDAEKSSSIRYQEGRMAEVLEMNENCYSPTQITNYEVTEAQSDKISQNNNKSTFMRRVRKVKSKLHFSEEQSKSSKIRHNSIVESNGLGVKLKKENLSNPKKLEQQGEFVQKSEKKVRKTRRPKHKSHRKLKKKKNAHGDRISEERAIKSFLRKSASAKKKFDLRNMYISQDHHTDRISLNEAEYYIQIDKAGQKLMDCILYGAEEDPLRFLNVFPHADKLPLIQLTPHVSYFLALSFAISGLNKCSEEVVQVFCNDVITAGDELIDHHEDRVCSRVALSVLDDINLDLVKPEESVGNQIEANSPLTLKSDNDASNAAIIPLSTLQSELENEPESENLRVENANISSNIYVQDEEQSDVVVIQPMDSEERNISSFPQEGSLIKSVIQSCYCAFRAKLNSVIQEYGQLSIPECRIITDFPVSCTLSFDFGHFQALSNVTYAFYHNLVYSNDSVVKNKCSRYEPVCQSIAVCETIAVCNDHMSNVSYSMTPSHCLDIPQATVTVVNESESAPLSLEQNVINETYDYHHIGLELQPTPILDDSSSYTSCLTENESVQIQLNDKFNKGSKIVNALIESPKFMKTFRQNQLTKKKLQRERNRNVQRTSVGSEVLSSTVLSYLKSEAVLISRNPCETPESLISSSTETEIHCLSTIATPSNVSLSIRASDSNNVTMVLPIFTDSNSGNVVLPKFTDSNSVNMVVPNFNSSSDVVHQPIEPELQPFCNILLPQVDDQAEQTILAAKVVGQHMDLLVDEHVSLTPDLTEQKRLEKKVELLEFSPVVTSSLLSIQVPNAAIASASLLPELVNIDTCFTKQPFAEYFPSSVSSAHQNNISAGLNAQCVPCSPVPTACQEVSMGYNILDYHPVSAPRFSSVISEQFSPGMRVDWKPNENWNKTGSPQLNMLQQNLYRPLHESNELMPRITSPYRFCVPYNTTDPRYALNQVRPTGYTQLMGRPPPPLLPMPPPLTPLINPPPFHSRDFMAPYPVDAFNSACTTNVSKSRLSVTHDSRMTEKLSDSCTGMNSRIYIFKQDNAVCKSIQVYLNLVIIVFLKRFHFIVLMMTKTMIFL